MLFAVFIVLLGVSVSSAVTKNEVLAGLTRGEYSIIDIGASKGGSAEAMISILNIARNQVVGVDIDPVKVQQCSEKDLLCIEQDITALTGCSQCVAGVTSFHIFEHLPSMNVAHAIWSAASNLARDFLYFRGPDFDNEQFLRRRRFYRFYENWTGHTLHLNTTHLTTLMHSTRSPRINVIFEGYQLKNTSHPMIHTVGMTKNTGYRDTPPAHTKPFMLLHKPIYSEMRALVIYNPTAETRRVWEDTLRWIGHSDATVALCEVNGKKVQTLMCVGAIERVLYPEGKYISNTVVV